MPSLITPAGFQLLSFEKVNTSNSQGAAFRGIDSAGENLRHLCSTTFQRRLLPSGNNQTWQGKIIYIISINCICTVDCFPVHPQRKNRSVLFGHELRAEKLRPRFRFERTDTGASCWTVDDPRQRPTIDSDAICRCRAFFSELSVSRPAG